MRFSLFLVLTLIVLMAGCRKANHSEPVKTDDSDRDAASSSPTDDDSADATEQTTDGPEVKIADGTLQLKEITFTIPEGWKQVENNSGFVLAEFALPRAEGDDADGRLTVSEAGGSLDDNLKRWRGQFGDKPEKESQEEIAVGEWKVTVVDYQGEFSDMRGPFAPATPRPGYRMLAAIFPAGDQWHFIKATGPQNTIAAQFERFQEFIKSARKTGE